MIPAAFDYARPASVDEALKLVAANPEAKVLAGGQSLIPLMKFRLSTPPMLIDLGGVEELTQIRRTDDGWRVGALTTYRQILDDAELCTAYPLLAEAVDGIADAQVRNRGTVGGSIAHCDPSSDLPAVALALDATVELRSASGERRIAVADFLRGPFETHLAPDEIVVAIDIPHLPRGAGTAWLALEQAASGYSIVGVAAVLADVHGVYGSAKLNHLRVAITGIGDHPYRATAVEAALEGTDCNAADVAGAASKACEGQAVMSDIHADAEYRTALASVYVRRALERARARAG